MILIKNTQRRIPLNIEKIRADVHRCLQLLGYVDFDIGIWFTTNKTIQAYNKHYRHKNKPTDILSFAYYPDLKPGERIVASHADDKNLGDLIISPHYIQEHLDETGMTFDKRMQVLLVHGMCHLLGYDHETDHEYAQMQQREEELLQHLSSHSA